jgi:hypothetical protein
MPVV